VARWVTGCRTRFRGVAYCTGDASGAVRELENSLSCKYVAAKALSALSTLFKVGMCGVFVYCAWR
jgi:hypothetical protein